MAIVQIPIEVDDQFIPIIRQTIGARLFDRQGLIAFPEGPVPANNAQVKAELARELRLWVKEYQARAAEKAARDAVAEIPVS